MSRLGALLLALAGVAWGQGYTPESFDSALASLDAQLDRDPKSALSSVPPEWNVVASGQAYAIPSSRLRTLLGKSDVQGAHGWIAQLREHVRTFQVRRVEEWPHAADSLSAILARPEFKPADPPTFLQRLWLRISEWLGDWLARIFRYAAEHPSGSQMLFWTLIAGSVAALAAWLYRLWAINRPTAIPTADPLERIVQSYQEWLKQARAAAARGETRVAIRCAYWAAVTRLQQDRALRLNFADTPRERLRRLQQPSRADRMLEPALIQPLVNITQSFERSWYGNLPTSEADAARSLQDAEALGCRAD